MEPIKGVIKEERETTISFMNGDTRIELYTSDNGIISKIERLMERGDSWVLERIDKSAEGEVRGYTFSAPINCLSLRAGKREVSEEQRERLRRHAEEIREKRKSRGS